MPTCAWLLFDATCMPNNFHSHSRASTHHACGRMDGHVRVCVHEFAQSEQKKNTGLYVAITRPFHNAGERRQAYEIIRRLIARKFLPPFAAGKCSECAKRFRNFRNDRVDDGTVFSRALFCSNKRGKNARTRAHTRRM